MTMTRKRTWKDDYAETVYDGLNFLGECFGVLVALIALPFYLLGRVVRAFKAH